MLSSKNLIRIAINSIFGIVLIIFWLQVVDINEIIKSFHQVNYYVAFSFIILFLIPTFIRALRIKILLDKVKVPYRNLLSLTFLSQLLSFTIPLRVGEIAKGVYLSTEYKMNFPKAVILIFLDRFLDFWLLLILASILLTFVPTNLPSSIQNTILILIFCLSLLFGLVVYKPKFVKFLSNFVIKLLMIKVLKIYFTKIADFIIETASFLNQGFKKTFAVLMLTFIALIFDSILWFVIFLAVFKGEKINFIQVFLGSLLTSLTYLLPAAPGYVGSAEASGVAVFSYGLGLDKNLTSVVTILAHGLTLFCILVFGIISLWFLKFDLKLVWKKFKREN